MGKKNKKYGKQKAVKSPEIIENSTQNSENQASLNKTQEPAGVLRDASPSRKKHFSLHHLKFYFILVLLCFIVGGGIYLWNMITSNHVERRHAELYSQIQKVAELTVLKNRYCDVICIRSSPEVKVGKVSAIVKYNGLFRAGIPDVTKIDVNISNNGKTVDVYVPHSQVLDNTLIPDQLELFDEKTFMFVKRVPTQEIFNGIADAMNEKQEQLVEEGILNDADVQLRSVVEGMLKGCGFEEIIYHWL